jgi:hypothetical protein
MGRLPLADFQLLLYSVGLTVTKYEVSAGCQPPQLIAYHLLLRLFSGQTASRAAGHPQRGHGKRAHPLREEEVSAANDECC